MWKETVVTYFEVLSRHASAGAQNNHEHPSREVRVRMVIQSENFQNTSQRNSSLETNSLGNNLGDAGLYINLKWMYIAAANWYYQLVKSPPETIHLKK
jgi:hypothetical protein